jgi:hypothetical protein
VAVIRPEIIVKQAHFIVKSWQVFDSDSMPIFIVTNSRRTSLMGWRSQDREGSNPFFRTNNLRRFIGGGGGQPVK